MKKNYKNTIKAMIVSMAFLLSAMSYSQDINFTFANAQNTNDGVDDFYEVDVMIETINTTGSFKLGSGQLYFNYNTAAFGTNISAAGDFEVTYPEAEGYIVGQTLAGVIDYYGPFNQNDNLPSRVSWNFTQAVSANTLPADNVTDTPAKLVHLKIKYIDVLESPMVMFYGDSGFDDQFFTACGGASSTPDCTGFPGMQLLNDTFDSAGSTLSDDSITLVNDMSIYPNPTSDVITIQTTATIEAVELFDMLGKQVLRTRATERIRVNQFPSGVYLLKIYSDRGNLTKKIVVE